MHPILFTAGSLRFPTYGALMVLAILAAICVVLRLGRREGLDSGQLLDFSTWLLLVSLLGAKVLMVLSDWDYYRRYPGEIFSRSTFLAGGVFYGGFIAALLFAVWYIRLHHLPFWKVVDVYAPAISLGLGVGRIGCFAAGCDYGKPTTSAWSVVFRDPFSHEVSGVPLGIPLYPTQLYLSLASLSILPFFGGDIRGSPAMARFSCFTLPSTPWPDSSWNSCEAMRTAGSSFIISCLHRSLLRFWRWRRQCGWL